ncbi:hypothetical protein Ae406Ps2_1597 [Pseudonocardia sp. Ae406_Ps2]|nr:hypothetical protein Ae406Ps2_1597 [Pseudonocardia sp. Ae406_Ps2]OLM23177.1 hypothetical protein Ae706Ps2_1610 [Pseudonocardia sp. Ae706_Ps2]
MINPLLRTPHWARSRPAGAQMEAEHRPHPDATWIDTIGLLV